MLDGLDNISLIFFWCFVGSAFLAIVYAIFGDILGGLFDAIDIGFINPTVILSFLSIFSGTAFISEYKTDWSLLIVITLSLSVAFILVSILHVFILTPVKNAEENTAYSLEDMVGKNGKITVPIPQDGFGQVSFESDMGYQSHPAKSKDGLPIDIDSEVRVLKIEQGVYVVKQRNSFNAQEES